MGVPVWGDPRGWGEEVGVVAGVQPGVPAADGSLREGGGSHRMDVAHLWPPAPHPGWGPWRPSPPFPRGVAQRPGAAPSFLPQSAALPGAEKPRVAFGVLTAVPRAPRIPQGQGRGAEEPPPPSLGDPPRAALCRPSCGAALPIQPRAFRAARCVLRGLWKRRIATHCAPGSGDGAERGGASAGSGAARGAQGGFTTSPKPSAAL